MKILRSQNVQNVKLSMTWWWFGGQKVTVWKNDYNLDFPIRLSKELRWQVVNASGRGPLQTFKFQLILIKKQKY